MSEAHRRTVESGYDQMAEEYLATKDPEHPTLLESVHRWLEPGGALLATMTVADYEGRDEDWEGWGAPMVWSHYDKNANVAMLRDAGFEIRYAEPRTGGGTGDETETWLWVLASKKSREGTT